MLVFNKVSFSYKDHSIFREVSCTIPQYSFTCIIGMNGSGKSTFAKLAVGILVPQSGEITYNNKVLSHTKIGYLQQKLLLSHSMPINVKEFVLMGCITKNNLFFSKADIEKTKNAIETCGLTHKFNTPLSQLSGGQIQRALIARLLVTDPEIIVLDEPFEGLDVQATQVLYNQLQLLKSKITIVMISHNLEIITTLSNNLICISDNKAHHNYIEYISSNKDIPVTHVCTHHN